MAFKKKLKLIEIEKPKLEKVNSELAFKVFQYSHNGADFINTDISLLYFIPCIVPSVFNVTNS